jgi:hypothetical protein
MAITKYTQPNIVFDASVSFIKNVQFDSSVYLKGITHITAPNSGSDDYALVVSATTGTLQVNSRLLGSMAWTATTDYITKLNIDSSFIDIWTQFGYVESSLNDLDVSIGQLNTWNTDQDLSINALFSATTNAWNGLELTDSSVGLGGALEQPTVITANVTNTLSIAGLQLASTELTAVTLVGNILRYTELGSMALASTSSYVLQSLFDTSITAIWTQFGHVESSLNDLDVSIGQLNIWNVNQDISIADLAAATTNAWNGLELTDSSVGLGGTLEQPTSIATDVVNTIAFTGMRPGTTRLAVISDSGVLKTQQLGSIALANTTDYVARIGDTMTGALTITGGGLVVGSTGSQLDVSLYSDVYVHNDLTVGGDLFIDGSLFVRSVETIDVSGAFILLNTGETGTPPASMQSGIVIDRGDTDSPFAMIYDESSKTLRIGLVELAGSSYADASTQAVATRQDTPTAAGVAYWNDTLYRFDTTSGFTYSSGVLTVPDLTLTGLAADAGTTALMITGNVVGTRTLGDAAFATSANLTATGPINVTGTGGELLVASAITIDQANTSTDGYLSSTDWNMFDGKQDDLTPNTAGTLAIMNAAAIASLTGGNAITLSGTSGGEITIAADVATSGQQGVVQVGAGITATTGTITPTWAGTGAADTVARSDHDHNDDYVGNILDATGQTGHSVIADFDGSTAYLKYIKAGTGATITDDASAITISVTGAEGYVSKYAGSFSPGTLPATDSSMTFTQGVHGLSVGGPFSIAVWEEDAGVRVLVFTEIQYNSSGDITLLWTPGSITGDCSVFIAG